MEFVRSFSLQPFSVPIAFNSPIYWAFFMKQGMQSFVDAFNTLRTPGQRHRPIARAAIQTPNSEVRLTATIPWSSLENHPQGSMKALFKRLVWGKRIY